MNIENASLAELQRRWPRAHHREALTRAYLARIEAYDRAGPVLNIGARGQSRRAARSRHARPRGSRARSGRSPASRSCVKDNIATGDRQHTTAGSLALAEARARRDATLVARLRAAGAVILGKANLTEFANIIAIDMPSGLQLARRPGKNPYAPARSTIAACRWCSPGGSSSGSAVAVAAGLCAAAIGTETSGSLLSPATQNGLVTVKPTVGLISRAGILPIAHSQDTAGPLDPHRARRGDPAERAGRARSARSGDTGASSGRPITPRFSTRTG